MVNVRPCVKYEFKLDVSKTTIDKIDKAENGVKKSKHFPHFTATMEIEGLLYVTLFKEELMRLE